MDDLDVFLHPVFPLEGDEEAAPPFFMKRLSFSPGSIMIVAAEGKEGTFSVDGDPDPYSHRFPKRDGFRRRTLSITRRKR